MRAAKTSRTGARRARRARKAVQPKRAPVKPVKAPARVAPPAPELVFYRLCKPGWSVSVEKSPNAQGTRFVCPFCPLSHRVPGPVRGFRKVRRAQWIKFRRIEE